MQFRHVQSFIGVDISEACEKSLIEEQGLELAMDWYRRNVV